MATTAESSSTASSPSAAKTTLQAYLSSSLDLNTTLTMLATPIEESYTSADSGYALWEAEYKARHQKTFFESEEEFHARWGSERLEIPESALQEIETGGRKARRTTEGQLWDLWHHVLDSAREISWRSQEEKMRKLVDLVRTLKARPNPPVPARATKALRNNWIWESGRLWSELGMLGPSAREEWNRNPKGSGEFSVEEMEGWLNLNAFVASLSKEGVKDFWDYGLWAWMDFEGQPMMGREGNGPSDSEAELCLQVVETWVQVAGVEIWKMVERQGGDGKEAPVVDANSSADNLPWNRAGVSVEEQHAYSLPRWQFWKVKLYSLSERKALPDKARQIAKDTARRMDDIEASHPSPTSV